MSAAAAASSSSSSDAERAAAVERARAAQLDEASRIILADSDDLVQATRDGDLSSEGAVMKAIFGDFANGGASQVDPADMPKFVAALARVPSHERLETITKVAGELVCRYVSSRTVPVPYASRRRDAFDRAVINASVLFARLKGNALRMIVWTILGQSMTRIANLIRANTECIRIQGNAFVAGLEFHTADSAEQAVIEEWMGFMHRLLSPALEAHDGPAALYAELQIGPYRDRFHERRIPSEFPEWITDPWTHVSMHSFCVAAQHFRTKLENADGSMTHVTLGPVQTMWDAEVGRIRQQRVEDARIRARQALEHTTMPSDMAYLMASYLDDDLLPPGSTKRKAEESKEDEEEREAAMRPRLAGQLKLEIGGLKVELGPITAAEAVARMQGVMDMVARIKHDLELTAQAQAHAQAK